MITKRALTDYAEALLPEPQRDVTCRVDEVTVAGVLPGHVVDAFVEGDQISWDEARCCCALLLDLAADG